MFKRLDCMLGVTEGAWKSLFGELESWGWPAHMCTDALPTTTQGHFSPESYQGCCWEICAPPFHVAPPKKSDKCLTDLSAKELVPSPKALFLCLTRETNEYFFFVFLSTFSCQDTLKPKSWFCYTSDVGSYDLIICILALLYFLF